MSISSPTDLPNVIAAWKSESGRFDAAVAGSNVTASRAKVKGWESYDGSALRLTQAVDANALVYDPTDQTLVSEQNSEMFFDAPPSVTINCRSFSLFLVLRLATLRASSTGSQYQFFLETTGAALNVHFARADGKLSVYSGGFISTNNIPATSWCTILYSFSAGAMTTYVNGVAVAGSPAAAGTDTLLHLLGSGGGAYAVKGKVKDLVLYSDAKDATAAADLHAYGVTRGAITTSDVCIESDGDSMTFGYGTTLGNGWVVKCASSANRLEHNTAESGILLQTLASEAAARVDPLIQAGKTNICRIFAGRNDLGSRTAAQIYGDRQTYVAARKLAGWDAVIYIGILPEESDDTKRQAIRTQDLLDFPTATAVPHVFTDGTGGYYIDYDDLTITRSDNLHPDDAGAIQIAGRVDAIMEVIAPSVDVTAPTVTAAINAAGTTVTWTFSESVTGVAAADFSLSGGHALSATAGSGTSWTMTITPAVTLSETITRTYTGTATIDASSNALATFSAQAVTNNSTLNVPGAPVLPVPNDGVEPAESFIIVSAQAPASNGGSAIIGYQYWRKRNDGNYQLIATQLGTSPSQLLDTGTADDDTVDYKVRCYNAIGFSAYSAEREVTSQGPNPIGWNPSSGQTRLSISIGIGI